MKPTAPDRVNASNLATDPLPWLISFSLDVSMFDTPASRAVAFAAAMFISVLVGSAARKGRRAMAVLGGFISSMGVITIAAHKIWQKLGGPPLEGSLATFGSVAMLVFGGYIMWLAFFQTPNDHSQRRSESKDLTSR
jgi:hypothetical protein